DSWAWVRGVGAAAVGRGIWAGVDIRVWPFANADPTVARGRPPVAPGILVRAETHVGEAGTGSTLATLLDAQGAFGSCAQSLLFDRRGGGGGGWGGPRARGARRFLGAPPPPRPGGAPPPPARRPPLWRGPGRPR